MKKMKKNISLAIVFALALCSAGCGNTNRPANAEAKENVENNLPESMDVDRVEDGVATTYKPAEGTAKPDTTATVSPAPTETSKPTATPAPTATPTDEPTPTPHVHQWTESVTREAGCSTDGEKKLTCECGESKVDTIPATGEHNWESVYQTVTHPSTGHVEERETQVQVGTSAGYTVYTCGVCGAQFDTPSEVVDHCFGYLGVDNNHASARTVATDYPGQPVYETRIESVWVVDTPETTSQELVGYTCSVCGATK